MRPVRFGRYRGQGAQRCHPHLATLHPSHRSLPSFSPGCQPCRRGQAGLPKKVAFAKRSEPPLLATPVTDFHNAYRKRARHDNRKAVSQLPLAADNLVFLDGIVLGRREERINAPL